MTAVQVKERVKDLSSRFDKAVDAIAWNEAQKTIAQCNIILNQQEEILRNLEAIRDKKEDDLVAEGEAYDDKYFGVKD